KNISSWMNIHQSQTEMYLNSKKGAIIFTSDEFYNLSQEKQNIFNDYTDDIEQIITSEKLWLKINGKLVPDKSNAEQLNSMEQVYLLNKIDVIKLRNLLGI
ncbi:MAG: hypothetical protein WCJ33_09975, partial [Pseudomonadota bacterium]